MRPWQEAALAAEIARVRALVEDGDVQVAEVARVRAAGPTGGESAEVAVDRPATVVCFPCWKPLPGAHWTAVQADRPLRAAGLLRLPDGPWLTVPFVGQQTGPHLQGAGSLDQRLRPYVVGITVPAVAITGQPD